MIKILIGLLALAIVVIIHELGHFIAARRCGVVVETFSIGWGPVLFRKKRGETEYRISALPIGGYCGMKGEHAFTEALDKKLDAIPQDPGSFYGVHPLKRVIIAFSGPFANLCFAAIVLAFVSAAGYTYQTYGNSIVPASRYGGEVDSPVDKAGLAEGDTIISLGEKKMANFSDIQQFVATRPEESFEVTYVRDGTTRTSLITPTLDKKTGSGKIGIYPYIPLVVGSIKEGSAADAAGMRLGDRVVAVNGLPVSHYMQFTALLKDKPEQVTISVERDGIVTERPLVLLYGADGQVESGIAWKTETVRVAGTDFLGSVKSGLVETGNTIALTIKSIALLFRGVDVTEAVSGPVRITMMIGEVAQTSLIGVAELLSVICVSLFLMNLLPIPILDGGLILFSVIEAITRKPLKPKTLYYVQFIGMAFIVCLFVFAMFGDIKYLMK